jgi:ubiquinone/menaquinone biosynthesis C-methylase UbiE
MHSHYGYGDPENSDTISQIDRLLEHTLSDKDLPEGPILDVGCGVGRSSFWLAEKHQRPVLGLDVNFAMLLHAQDVLLNEKIRYGLRRIGIVYDWKEYSVQSSHRNLVDFWVADATCLPFRNQQIGSATTLNVVDCTSSPTQYLRELTRVSKEWHSFCPYDWSSSVTEFGQWLGGHSSFSPWNGDPESVIRYLLSEESSDPLLKTARVVREEPSLPWKVRVHNRSTTDYDVHYVHAVVDPNQRILKDSP